MSHHRHRWAKLNHRQPLNRTTSKREVFGTTSTDCGIVGTSKGVADTGTIFTGGDDCVPPRPREAVDGIVPSVGDFVPVKCKHTLNDSADTLHRSSKRLSRVLYQREERAGGIPGR
jgi:hypothetical protein